ncbi:MAG: LPS export ABC transporter periplasmic protein LptC [Spirochaetaceae bacterium]|jgi:LPS export ABC transporter protein LptC|nr:LPS export ABC transporter periplasmic protein LptC [Spirochaetaceae bacterium]
MAKDILFAACGFLIVVLGACSFDYGPASLENDAVPDVVMNDVEYVRVKDGNPLVRFEAEGAERYEKRQTMELKNFSFEQFDAAADVVNATGRAANASVQLESGNIHMKNGVLIQVDSEDIAIETQSLEWQDTERRLSAGAGEPVAIRRMDGTSFTGWGFSADVRHRTWSFTDGVQGVYIETDDDADDDEEDDPGGGDEGTPAIPQVPEEAGEWEAVTDDVK